MNKKSVMNEKDELVKLKLQDCQNYREEIGNNFYLIPNDLERTLAIYRLLEEDEANLEKIMISTDRCLKMELTTYGGFGYEHILKNIVPMMKKVGF